MNEPQFVRSTAPHIVEVAEGTHHAKSKSATIGTDAKRAYTHSTEFVDAKSSSADSSMDLPLADSNSRVFIHADPSAELKAVFFDPQSAMAALPSLELDPAEVNALLLSSTSVLPVITAPAALDEHGKKPKSSPAHFTSHFSDQIGDLKEKNDHVRAELKRRESAPSTKT